MKNQRVNVAGLGYIGLPTALTFSSHGVEVTGTNDKPHVIGAARQEIRERVMKR